MSTLPSGLRLFRPLNASPGVGGVGSGDSSSRSGDHSSTSGLSDLALVSMSMSSPPTLGSEILGVNRFNSFSDGGMISSELSGSGMRGWLVRKKKTLRGCTGINSFAKGHGESAVHGRLRYRLSLEESRAAGFADLVITC